MSGWAIGLPARMKALLDVQVDAILPAIKAIQGPAVLTGSGTFTVPADVTRLYVTAVGGGGGGGGGYNPSGTSPSTAAGGGGGAGAIAYRVPVYVSPGLELGYAVGAGGVGGTATTYSTDGGNTVFGDLTVGGGKGGAYNTPSSPTTKAGASGAVPARFGAFSVAPVAAVTTTGGSGVFGDGGTSSGNAGVGFGAGGGGKASGSVHTGGDGAPGVIIVEVA